MNPNIYNPYVRQELELYHHGILGQRWGKKNGPPYPLGASDHSASEKRAGWRKSLAGGWVKDPAINSGAVKRMKDAFKANNPSWVRKGKHALRASRYGK